ncbi:conserved hypothetical protein [Coccidioides posadasii str. Silveira]|uniref:Uncharacterized protein n=2 Tax=Coccidioides posadasii TaxID=199306 RepID=E9D9F9_COCPS|nr:conserved hypothetical protein [Coccidioides posadasii str. Silveira]KMM70103.1 hypothetical protein CPAG_06415 [Coccidioides posadasii RMSCC 3488]
MGTSGLVGPSLPFVFFFFFLFCFAPRKPNQQAGKERRRSNYTLQVLNEEGNRWHQSIAQPSFAAASDRAGEDVTQRENRACPSADCDCSVSNWPASHPNGLLGIPTLARETDLDADYALSPDPIDTELGRRRPIQRNFRGTS